MKLIEDLDLIRLNPLWFKPDYSEFDKPTVIRRRGLEFLSRLWRGGVDSRRPYAYGRHPRRGTP